MDTFFFPPNFISKLLFLKTILLGPLLASSQMRFLLYFGIFTFQFVFIFPYSQWIPPELLFSPLVPFFLFAVDDLLMVTQPYFPPANSVSLLFYLEKVLDISLSSNDFPFFPGNTFSSLFLSK